MFSKKAQTIALSGAAVFALALPFTLRSSVAQAQNPSQRTTVAGQAQRGAPGQVQQRPGADFPQMQRILQGGLGGTAMVADGGFLYIVQGPRLFKVQKNDLRVVGDVMLGGIGPGGPALPPGGAGPRPPRGNTVPPPQ
jgi:hypothetical protein